MLRTAAERIFMADKKNRETDEPPFDRQAYLREIRQNILRNLGLPEDTRPEQVARLLEIKQKLTNSR